MPVLPPPQCLLISNLFLVYSKDLSLVTVCLGPTGNGKCRHINEQFEEVS